MQCLKWVYCRCLFVLCRATPVIVRDILICRICFGQAATGTKVADFKYGGVTMEVLYNVCCLRDILSSYGGVTDVLSPRIGGTWNKFSELIGINWLIDWLIVKKVLSFKLQGKLYIDAIRPVLLYWSKTWELTCVNELRLQSAERWMIRIMYCVKLSNSI